MEEINKGEDNEKEDVEKAVSKRMNKIFSFIYKDKNYLIILILVFALLLRLYYFFLTKNQALWWDSLSYGSMAKNYLYLGEWSHLPIIAGEITIRPPLMSLAWAILMGIGFNESMSKIFLEILPSLFSVLLVYLIVKESSDEKVALICAFILSFLWMHLFYSMRMLTGIPSLFLSLMSIYFFFKSENEIKTKYFALSIFFLSISILARYPFGLVGAAFLIFLILTQKLSFIKKKSFWKGGFIGITPILIFLLSNLILKGNIFPAAANYVTSSGEKSEYAFYTLNFIPHILQIPLLLAFILGVFVVIGRLALSYDFISKSKRLRFDLFNIILAFLTLAFFIFYIKASEDRYLFIMTLPILLLASEGIIFLYNQIKSYNKQLAIVFLVIFLTISLYANYSYGDQIIRSKVDSFGDIKQAFLWLDENAPENSTILGETSSPYVIYYTSLNPIDWPREEIPEDYHLQADYIVWTAYHWHNNNIKDYVPKITEELEPIYGAFFNGDKNNPSVLIYKVKK